MKVRRVSHPLSLPHRSASTPLCWCTFQRRCRPPDPTWPDLLPAISPFSGREKPGWLKTGQQQFATATPSGDVNSHLPQVTDPILLYHALVREGKIRRDEAQLRALYQMRPIHEALIGYRPPLHLLTVFDAAQLAPPPSMEDSSSSSSLGWRIPPLPKWSTHHVDAKEVAIAEQERNEVLQLSDRERERQLVKVLTEEEEFEYTSSPLGFLLTGPPGTGKSLLMDIFFDSLPTPFKVRRHYHHFLLSLYSQVFEELERRRLSLDALSPSRSRHAAASSLALSRGWRAVFAGGLSPSAAAINSADFVLARVARDLIRDKGWLLAFDEVQLIDVAGAGIVKRVVEWYWRLGGVVIGTSNRVPEHMYDQGVQKQQLASFLRALQIRSPPIGLTSPFDWRRLDRSGLSNEPEKTPSSGHVTTHAPALKPGEASWLIVLPGDVDASLRWENEVAGIIGDCGPGGHETLEVYGRVVGVPWAAKSRSGSIARFTYKELCDRPLGPADYISIASNYDTLIVEDVPVFTLTMKNEARRFITFLDAAYECRIKLLISAARPIDEIFFPEAATVRERRAMAAPATQTPLDAHSPDDVVDMSARGSGHHFSADRIYEGDNPIARPPQLAAEEDSLTEEALSEVIQDLEAPFRPNVSSYRDSSRGAAFEEADSDLADGRSPSEPLGPMAIRSKSCSEVPQHPSATMTPAFASLSIFTGEDERFAYKRAVSRLHEVTSPTYWRDVVWRPLPREARTWERGTREPVSVSAASSTERVEAFQEEAAERRILATPPLKPEDFRTTARKPSLGGKKPKRDPLMDPTDPWDLEPPKISSVHAWGVAEGWGERAGRWGRGVKAFEDEKAHKKGGH